MRLVCVSRSASSRPRKNATVRTTVLSGVRTHGVRIAHGAQSRFAPRTCLPT